MNTGGLPSNTVDSSAAVTGGTGGLAGDGSGGSTCMNTNGAGGNSAQETIGVRIPIIATLSFYVNRSDGFSSPARSDVWTVDITSRAVTLNAATSVTASEAQVQDLVTRVGTSNYRDRPACCTYQLIDGYPNSPVITVSGGNATYTFGVGDNPCWLTANAYSGQVIGCADFGAIYNLLETIAPSGAKFNCQSYF